MGPANETNFIDNSDIQPCDVLLGRGTLCAFHVGSIAFKVAVASRLDAYLKMTSQKTKTRLTVDIMRSIRLAGGRFLSRNQGPKTVHQTGEAATIQWYEVNSNVARVKIRDVFRDCIKSMKKESRPSLLLDDLGLLGQFDHISTFSEIVKYVATSSRVREYTYIRNDLINERKKKRSAAILREEKQACGIQDGSVVESRASYSAVGCPCRLPRRAGSSRAAPSVLSTDQEETYTSPGHDQVDWSENKVTRPDEPVISISSSLSGIRLPLCNSTETVYEYGGTQSQQWVGVYEEAACKYGNTVSGKEILVAAPNHDKAVVLSHNPSACFNKSSIWQAGDNTSNEGGIMGTQQMTLFKSSVVLSPIDDTNLFLPPAPSECDIWASKENSASLLSNHDACATRDEVLETALLLSHENDSNALFDYCLDHWNDLECTATISAV